MVVARSVGEGRNNWGGWRRERNN